MFVQRGRRIQICEIDYEGSTEVAEQQPQCRFLSSLAPARCARGNTMGVALRDPLIGAGA